MKTLKIDIETQPKVKAVITDAANDSIFGAMNDVLYAPMKGDGIPLWRILLISAIVTWSSHLMPMPI